LPARTEEDLQEIKDKGEEFENAANSDCDIFDVIDSPRGVTLDEQEALKREYDRSYYDFLQEGNKKILERMTSPPHRTPGIPRK